MTSFAFQRRQPAETAGYPLFKILGKTLTKGEVGIEVEVEGNKFPKPPGYEGTHQAKQMPGWDYWSYVRDGSLRGTDNAEYVLTKPIAFDAVPAAVAELQGKLNGFGSVLADSNRTSVHVHLNAQTFHMNRLAAFTALYFCFEEVLTEWAGDHRVGNLFCLRGKDAPGLISKLRQFIQTDGRSDLTEGLHYSGLNIHALTKFGSLEVRTLRGPTTDMDIVLQWVSILERLYKLSESYTDPRDIPALFSQMGPTSFFETILGETASLVRSGISFDEDQIRDSMYDGIRLAQDLCYCRDWTNFKPVGVKTDPFGRVVMDMEGFLPTPSVNLNDFQPWDTPHGLSPSPVWQNVTVATSHPDDFLIDLEEDDDDYDFEPDEDEEEE